MFDRSSRIVAALAVAIAVAACGGGPVDAPAEGVVVPHGGAEAGAVPAEAPLRRGGRSIGPSIQPDPAATTAVVTSTTGDDHDPLPLGLGVSAGVIDGRRLPVGAPCDDSLGEATTGKYPAADIGTVTVDIDESAGFLVMRWAFDPRVLAERSVEEAAASLPDHGADNYTIWLADPDGTLLGTIGVFNTGTWRYIVGLGVDPHHSCPDSWTGPGWFDTTTTVGNDGATVETRWSLEALNGFFARIGGEVTADSTWFATTGGGIHGPAYFDRCPDM